MKTIFYIIYESTRLLTKEKERHRVANASFALFYNALVWYMCAALLSSHLLPKDLNKLPFIFLAFCLLVPLYFFLKRDYVVGFEVSSSIYSLKEKINLRPWQLHFISLVYNFGGIILSILAGIYY